MSEKENRISFGRIFWPSLWAALIVSILGLIIWLIVIGGIIGSLDTTEQYKVKKNTILHMTLDGKIAERAKTRLEPFSFEIEKQIGLSDILFALKTAEKDDKIEGIFIEIGDLFCGYSTAKEIRDAINEFEKSGKFVVAYNSGELVTQKEYYVASAANENYGFPSSNVQFLGLGGELAFFKNTMDKLDVEMQVIRGSNNDFKSAVEPFFRESMSDSSRLQMERYITGIWQDLKSEIAADRKLSVELLDSLAENALITDVEDAVDHKLIDAVKYRDEVLQILAEKLKVKNTDDLVLAEFEKYAKKKFYQDQILLEHDDPNIAVILAEGGVSTQGEGLTSKEICRLFREVRNNESVKTVVFRINSPGGSALASDEIWREVKLTNEKKKVIVSMGDVAASGGYYIAAPAHKIFAEPTTITGSIGVFGVIPYTGKMFENKLGVTFDRVSTNKHSILTTNRKLTPEELAVIQKSVDEIYLEFKERVAEGRNMTVAEVDIIARGRVWTGRDAKRIGLVDELGGIRDAIDFAAKEAKIKDKKVLYYPIVKKDFLSELIEEMEEQRDMEIETAQTEMPKELVAYYKQLKTIEEFTGIQMRLPYQITLH